MELLIIINRITKKNKIMLDISTLLKHERLSNFFFRNSTPSIQWKAILKMCFYDFNRMISRIGFDSIKNNSSLASSCFTRRFALTLGKVLVYINWRYTLLNTFRKGIRTFVDILVLSHLYYRHISLNKIEYLLIYHLWK